MKKFFSLVAIAAVAATMLTSCSKDDDKPTPSASTPKLTLSAAPASVAIGAEGEFTVTSDIAAPEAITVTVTSSAAATLTVDPASVTIAKGEKTAKGKFKGVADGKAKITIAASGVTLSVPSVDITVGTPPVPGAQIQKLNIDPADGWNGFLGYNDEETIFFNFYEVAYEGGEGMGSICNDFGKGTVKAMGTLNANGFLGYTAQTAGTAIKLDDMISPEKGRPVVWSSAESMTSLATGEPVYIVFAAGDFDNTSDEYRVWAQIKIGTAGGWSALQVLEAYACLNDGEFKVGQKE